MTVKELREQIEEMKTAEIQLDKLYLFMKGDKKLNQEITIKAQLSEMVDDLPEPNTGNTGRRDQPAGKSNG